MLIRDRKHPHGYHVDRHPPPGVEGPFDSVVLFLAVIGCGLIFLLLRYSNLL